MMTDETLRKVNRSLGQMRGRIAEDLSMLKSTMEGYEVRRTGIGSDYKRRKINLLTMPKGRWEDVEVKTGSSQLTPRQRKTRSARKGRYVVDRSSSPW